VVVGAPARACSAQRSHTARSTSAEEVDPDAGGMAATWPRRVERRAAGSGLVHGSHVAVNPAFVTAIARPHQPTRAAAGAQPTRAAAGAVAGRFERTRRSQLERRSEQRRVQRAEHVVKEELVQERTHTVGAVPDGAQRPHLMREVIRGRQRSSEVVRGHQRSSEVIRGHQRSSEVGAQRPHVGQVLTPPRDALADGETVHVHAADSTAAAASSARHSARIHVASARHSARIHVASAP